MRRAGLLRSTAAQGAMATVLLGVLVLTGCGKLSYGDSASAVSAASPHSATRGLNCGQARAMIRRQIGYAGPLSCRKAVRLAALLPKPKASGAQREAPLAAASLLPTPSPEPPANAREIQTGPDIGQWQQAGTSITSLWMDLEAGMNVEIEGASLDSDAQQGAILINIIDQSTADQGNIGGYVGGTYPTPQMVGPVTLTSIAGSLATGDMTISFSYAGGTGTFNPQAGQFTMS